MRVVKLLITTDKRIFTIVSFPGSSFSPDLWDGEVIASISASDKRASDYQLAYLKREDSIRVSADVEMQDKVGFYAVRPLP